ncbi:MAG: UDP-N-acetylmuramoyl-L-alanine--D-glutamate ligase [Acidobacteriota bacterium]
MTEPSPLPWRHALVYGLGLSGRAAAQLLRARGVAVTAVDRRPASSLELDAAFAGDAGFRALTGAENPAEAEIDWREIDGVVVSPGVPPQKPLLEAARAAGVPVIGEVELAFRHAEGPVVGITGSNGKSTTTALTGAMLRALRGDGGVRVCGNIGDPFSGQLTSAPDAKDGAPEASDSAPLLHVVELSSFQLETVDRFHPVAGALLNLASDHLDRHPDFKTYRDAKMRLFARQGEGDLAVNNADDPRVREAAGALAGRVRLFSRTGPVEDGCFLDGDTVMEIAPGSPPLPLFAATDVPLPGPHNLENAMAAALLARALGAEPVHLRRGLHGFSGLPHRLQLVREIGGVVWFDDSKGTNPAATLGSLSGFEDGRVLIILGGIFKGGDLEGLCRLVARKARVAYLIGESAELFERALRPFPGMITTLERAGTLANAVEGASQTARPGETVLLSPACSSFDQFTDYSERGRVFQRLVHETAEASDGA